MKFLKILPIIFLTFVTSLFSQHDIIFIDDVTKYSDRTFAVTGWRDFRDFNNLTFDVNSRNKLPFIKLSGWIDIYGGDYIFAELCLSQPLKYGLGIEFEYNDTEEINDSSYKIGVSYSILEILKLRAFGYKPNDTGKQISLLCHVPLSNELALSGYLDRDFDDGGSNKWSSEVELVYTVSQGLSFCLEYRLKEHGSLYHQRVVSPGHATDETSFAFGARIWY